MPTSYTSYIQEGMGTSAADFLLKCSRQFGATVHTKGLTGDTSIELATPNIAHYEELLQKAIKRLNMINSLTEEQIAIKCDLEYKRAMEEYNRVLEEAKVLRERYEKLIDKVKAWNPPTKEHKNLKKFAIDQLEQSMDFDCNYEYLRVPRSPQEWLRDEIEDAEQSIKRNKERIKEEIERTEKSNKWIIDLKLSLSDPDLNEMV